MILLNLVQGCSKSLVSFTDTTLFCLISVGYHLELCVATTLYQQYCLLPTKLYHVLRCAFYLLMSFG